MSTGLRYTVRLVSASLTAMCLVKAQGLRIVAALGRCPCMTVAGWPVMSGCQPVVSRLTQWACGGAVSSPGWLCPGLSHQGVSGSSWGFLSGVGGWLVVCFLCCRRVRMRYSRAVSPGLRSSCRTGMPLGSVVSVVCGGFARPATQCLKTLLRRLYGLLRRFRAIDGLPPILATKQL